MKLLAIDTATARSSVALWLDGEIIARESPTERGHGGHILSLVDAVLSEGGTVLGALDALAFGRGPGAFTGIRLAASVTQGLAYAAELPVVPVSNLRALAQQVIAPGGDPVRALVCLDARMAEVYWAGFLGVGGIARPDTPERVEPAAQVLAASSSWVSEAATIGTGSGFDVYPELAGLASRLTGVRSARYPRAREIATLAAHDGLEAAVPAEQALPVYIRDRVAVVPADPGTGVS